MVGPLIGTAPRTLYRSKNAQHFCRRFVTSCNTFTKTISFIAILNLQIFSSLRQENPSFSISALPLQLSATRAHPHM